MNKYNTVNIDKKIVNDIFTNIIGTALPIITLNLIVYPTFAKQVSIEIYGQMHSVMSLIYIVCGTFGSTLCTIRLVKQNNNDDIKNIGDYNQLLIISTLLSVFVLILGLKYIININELYHAFLLIMVGTLCVFELYLEVYFRLKIDYKKYLFVNYYHLLDI